MVRKKIEIAKGAWNALPMQILSHRGHWLDPEEKNSEIAFVRAFEAGFGVETDVRDLAGELVISHNPPRGGEMPFGAFLDLHARFGQPGTLALNVKADGLQDLLRASLEKHRVERYFLFDMSVPDLLKSTQSGLACFCRQSEFEAEPLSLYAQCKGVWVDCFVSDWIAAPQIQRHLEQGKSVCLVSPELHHRPHLPAWERLRLSGETDRVMLCTDFPQEARAFFEFR